MNFFEYLYFRAYLGFEKQDGAGWLARYSAISNPAVFMLLIFIALLNDLVGITGTQSHVQLAADWLGLKSGVFGLIFIISMASALIFAIVLLAWRHERIMSRNMNAPLSSYALVVLYYIAFLGLYIFLALYVNQNNFYSFVSTVLAPIVASITCSLFFQRKTIHKQ